MPFHPCRVPGDLPRSIYIIYGIWEQIYNNSVKIYTRTTNLRLGAAPWRCAGPGGRTMITSYRVHQDQIRHLKQFLKIIYSARPAPAAREGEDEPSVPAEEGRSRQEPVQPSPPVSDADAWSEASSMVGTVLVQAEPDGNPGPVPRCRRCGYSYPLMDYFYTQKTGLCIPCWEENGI